MNSGPWIVVRGQERRERNHLPVVVAHVELVDVLDPNPARSLGLDEDFPLASEAVELVDVDAPEERLEGLSRRP